MMTSWRNRSGVSSRLVYDVSSLDVLRRVDELSATTVLSPEIVPRMSMHTSVRRIVRVANVVENDDRVRRVERDHAADHAADADRAAGVDHALGIGVEAAVEREQVLRVLCGRLPPR